MLQKFKGPGVAMITPFHRYGTVDFNSFERLIEHVISNGIKYLVIMSPVGEPASLSKDEKFAIMNFVNDIVQKRIPVIIGIRADNTQESINKIKNLDFNQVDAILSGCPTYNLKIKQKGVYAHFKEIATVSEVPVFIYNAPEEFGVHIQTETLIRLANDYKNIYGICDFTGLIQKTMLILNYKPDDFLVIEGSDYNTFSSIVLGADGGVSALANVFPKMYSSLVTNALNGNYEIAKDIHYRFLPLIDNLDKDCSVAGIKSMLNYLDLCNNDLRLPLTKIKKSVLYNLKTEIEKISPLKKITA